MIILENQNLSEIISSGISILYFSAPWCGPCKQLQPVMDSVSSDGVNVVKINVDDNSDQAENYNIRSVPTIIFTKNGEEVSRKVGAVQKNAISEIIASI